MRHSRFTQSYQHTPATLEVTDVELFTRRQSDTWNCQTIAQMGVPKSEKPCQIAPDSVPTEKPTKRRLALTTTARGLRDIVRVSSGSDVSRIHRDNIHRRLAQRIKAAKARGDQKLLRLLESELKDVALR